MCDALHFLLDNIFIRFGSKLYWQIVGIPMGTNCAPLVADLFLFCYERDFMLSLSDNNQADIIEAFYSTSRYFDDLLNIDNPYFEQMVGQIYPTELQLNKANSSDTEAPFLDLNMSITNGIVSSKIYDKRDDFNFEIVKFPFLDGDVPLSPSYGVYISQLIRFARVCSNVDDFNNRNEFKRIVGKPNFSDQFKKIVKRYIRVVVDVLFIVTPIVGVCDCSMFCCTLLYVHSSIAIILMGKRELIALLNLSSWCLVVVERLFLAVPQGCLQFVIVVFPDHTHLLFWI